jgi:tetratricopeptide (TPR) repeat protein
VSDNPQADLLARWLSEAGSDVSFPDALDSDAVEAVLALRPDLAPAPRVSIADVFDLIKKGPLIEPDAADVAVLTKFLGTVDRDDVVLDDDIQETIFALRPDLAPAPQVSMDDILSAVTAGPFASSSAAESADVSPAAPLAAELSEPLAAEIVQDAAAEIVQDAAAEIAQDAAAEIAQDAAAESAQDAAAEIAQDAVAGSSAVAETPTSAVAETPTSAVAESSGSAEAESSDPVLIASSPRPLVQPSAPEGFAAQPEPDQNPVAGLPESAADSSNPVGAELSGSDSAPVVSLDRARQERTRNKKAWWALPGVGAIACAAAALLMLNPSVMNLPEPVRDLQMEEPLSVSARPKSAPVEPESRRQLEMADTQRAELQASEEALRDEVAPTPELPSGPATEAPVLTAEASAAGTLAKKNEAEPLLDSAAFRAPASAASAFEDEALSGLAPASGSVDAAEMAISSGSSPAPAPPSEDEAEAAEEEMEAAAVEQSTSSGRSGWQPRNRNRSAEDSPSAQDTEVAFASAGDVEEAGTLGYIGENADEDSVAPEANRDETAALDDAPGLGQEALLDQLRSSAWSLQPLPDIGARHPELAAAYAAAEAEWSAGRMDVAVELLSQFAYHSDPDVVLDMTWKHAQMRYRMGEILGALEVIARGLLSAGGDPLLRSRLYALQGQLLERRGQPEEAIRAYRMAVEVR